MRFVLFALVGVALGYVLSFLAGLAHTKGPGLVLLVARLLVFVAVVGWLSRAYGPAAGLSVLVAAVATRGLLLRRAGHGS